jgi:P27 family predicted phage terminase small subunit
MPGGRPRTPTRVLQLRGTHRKDRHGSPEAEIQFAVLTELPPCPGFFDDVARYEWDRVGPELVAKQLLTEMDLAAFTLYCLNVARVVACEKVINQEGMTIRTPQGFELARPEVSIARQCGVEVRKFAQEFGLTPSARTRVRAPETTKPKAKSGWEDVG